MAEKRMFTKKITDSSAFYQMPSSAQTLYFHLNMAADDDGFNNQIDLAIYKSHASIDDLKTLIDKRFVLAFDKGVIVIKHWRMHNAIRKDRYIPTPFQEELSQLILKENNSYTENGTRLPNGCQMVAVDKGSVDKVSIDKNSINSSEQINLLEADISPTFIELPLVDKTKFIVTEEMVNQYQELCPSVDVKQALRDMKRWLISNPVNGKTRRGITRFINSWLSKEQDKGKTRQRQGPYKASDVLSDMGL